MTWSAWHPRRPTSDRAECEAGSAAAIHSIRFERVTGIEPAFSAWEADVLPLNYTREGGTEVSVGP